MSDACKDTGEDLILDSNEAICAYFVRIAAEDKGKAAADIKTLFGEITVIDKYDDELGFLTSEMQEGELKAKLTDLAYRVIGFIRVLA